MDKMEEKYLGSSVDGPADIFDEIIETSFQFPFCPIHDLIPKIVDTKESMVSFGNGVWNKRPFQDNSGGVSFEGAFYLYEILQHIGPSLVVESGVWRGMTTYIIDSVGSVSNLYCLDPLVSIPDFIKYRSRSAKYYDKDFGSSCFSNIEASKVSSLAFFDDHQDQLERVLLSYIRGYDWVLFDDNYAYGGGGHASLTSHIQNSIVNAAIHEIYLCTPLFVKNKGVEPIFSEIPSEILPFIKDQSNDYNWMTLCRLKKPQAISYSQGQLPLDKNEL